MRVCPICGYKNADEAETCPHCDSRLVESPALRKVLWFLLGVMLGLIPAAIFLLGRLTYQLYDDEGRPGWPFLGCLLLPIMLFALDIVWPLLRRKALRPVGSGLLVGLLTSPVVMPLFLYSLGVNVL